MKKIDFSVFRQKSNTSGTSSTGVEWPSLKAPAMLRPERSSSGMQCDRNMVMRPHSSELDALESLYVFWGSNF